MKIVFSILFVVSCALAVVGHITARTEIRATAEVCALIRDNFFRVNEPDVRLFLKKCSVDSIPFTYTREKAIEHINDRLSQINTSHLTLYAPSENRMLWDNEGSDTGLRTRMIESEVVVIGTLEGSPARKAELKSGDVVVSINGEQPTSVQDAQSTAGFYKISRGGKFFQTDLKLVDLHEDLSPKLEDLGGGVGLLRIPSFLPMYFEKDPWLQVAQKFSSFSKLVIDLRGNAGGSFPAMLRALSPFKCDGKEIGRIWRQPRPGLGEPQVLNDDLSADAQLEQIEASNEVILKPFSRYGCFSGRTLVLVDQNTSSVSEIFAHAMPRVWVH